MRGATFLLRSLTALTLLFATVAAAEHLPLPQGPVILTVEGRIGHTNRDGAAEFDRAMLESFGRSTLTTHTPWTDGPRQFGGVPFTRLLDELEVSGGAVNARALNDYVISIPVADISAKQAFLALSMDGKALSVRDKGPIWIVFPWDQDPALADQTTKHQSIWQLRTLTFE